MPTANEAILSLTDAVGKTVLTQIIFLEPGINLKKLNLDYLPKGTYILTLNNKENVLKSKIILE